MTGATAGSAAGPDPGRPVRVLVVDDDPLVRSALVMVLGGAPDLLVVGEAADGDEVPAATAAHRPDVVLMDVRMPRMDGIEATRRITAAGRARVLVLTTFDLDEYVYDAVVAGASGFLLKDVRPRDLAHAVRSIAAGDSLVAPTVTRRLLEEFVRRPPAGRRADRLAALTDREIEVLALVAQGLSNTEVAARLFVTETTVKSHLAHVFAKLGVASRTAAVSAARRSGVLR